MRAVFHQPKRNTDVKFKFDYKGNPVEVKARVRPDGTMAGNTDYFVRGHLVFSTDRQMGTLEDAVAEFIAFQEGQTPKQVYDNDTDRLGVGEDGPIRNSADDQVKRMNNADEMVSTGRMGFRYKTPSDQEYDL